MKIGNFLNLSLMWLIRDNPGLTKLELKKLHNPHEYPENVIMGTDVSFESDLQDLIEEHKVKEINGRYYIV